MGSSLTAAAAAAAAAAAVQRSHARRQRVRVPREEDPASPRPPQRLERGAEERARVRGVPAADGERDGAVARREPRLRVVPYERTSGWS